MFLLRNKQQVYLQTANYGYINIRPFVTQIYILSSLKKNGMCSITYFGTEGYLSYSTTRLSVRGTPNRSQVTTSIASKTQNMPHLSPSTQLIICLSFKRNKLLSQFRRLLASLATRRPRFHPRPVHVQTVADPDQYTCELSQTQANTRIHM